MNQGSIVLESTELLGYIVTEIAERNIHMDKEVGKDDPEFLLSKASRIQDLHFKNGKRSRVIRKKS